MKKSMIKRGLIGVVAAGMMTSCASDYLDLAPVTSVATNQVTSNETVAEATYLGVLQYMYTQYSGWQPIYPGNGESWINMFYGEAFGQDDLVWLYGGINIGTYILNFEGMNHKDYWFSQYMWKYCYNLISASNNFLVGIDKCEGTDGVGVADPEVAYMKAGILCIRAHAYIKLLQTYAPRWEDSNNGETKCLVLRLEPTTEGLPLVSMNEVIAQVKKDLDTAIELFTVNANGMTHKTATWEPDLPVAQGLYARLALLTHDFPTAQKMAHDARQNHPIMSKEQCKEGFAYANQEYMWCNMASNENYYWAWGSFYACNGAYISAWGSYGAGAINYDLYKQIPEGDVRRSFFWTPDKDLFKVKPKDFWNEKVVDAVNMDMNGLNDKMKISINSYGNTYQPNATWPAAYTSETLGAGEHVYVPFGAQFKFWAFDDYGTNQYPYMRASEMLLTEAEAAYENGDIATAQACLTELNSKRQDGYTCSSTGDALRDEIRLYRRIELWGEGHNFFDLKRWNVPLVRRPWIAGDETSNNIPKQYAVTIEPGDYYGWRFSVPNAEIQYNDMIKEKDVFDTEPEAKPAQ